ncbi:cationic amino acid transporter 9, chloroplastic isoform X2 [Apium graveolens]|uniref:cationic amino acid transporter 9, chloroplastic isoform X2 n=1 Tax=Apium graveolens TaxID=4045 RepID=UPI003D79E0E0
MRDDDDDIRFSSSSFFSNFWSSALRAKTLASSKDNNSVRTDGLIRRLGLFDLVLIGIGASIGAGIFVVTGTVAHDAGPGVTISFILAGASCVLNALCYAELASRFPAVVGGAYLYSYTAFNELTAFLVFAQMMLDYHIGAASIARSLSSYVVTILELIPFLRDTIPSWVGHGSEEMFGALSFNILAPVLLVLLTLILCQGVGESSMVNSLMTVTKVVIVIVVIIIGSFKVDVSNWTPFAPNGYKAVFTGATVVFFAYVGFDAVANSAEESKRPQRDLPLGIIGSLFICIVLYIGVCLVITGMVPYYSLGEEAPLAEAFTSKGLKYVSVLISVGAVAGLTTTLLVGLYVQSRLYLGLGRDGLLPPIFAKVHPTHHTPIHSQVWVGIVAIVLAGLFNVQVLSHILSVGSLTGYSVVSACVITLRWTDKPASQASARRQPNRMEVLAIASLFFHQAYTDPPGFSCPWVPVVPALSILFNMFLFAQLHYEAYLRFVVLSIIGIFIYALYGQYHANPSSSSERIVYHRAATEEVQ